MALYSNSPLLTDLYQFTMAYGYWKLGMHEQQAVFHLLFRKNPFKSNYAVSCGLGSVIEYLSYWHLEADDIDYLSTLKNQHNEPLFPSDFLNYLANMRFTCDLDAVPEGNVVFPHMPLLRIQGPILQCQLLETPLLNIINFQTLIATKASRVCRAAGTDNVIEFGMRRAQGPNGALSASRAAYIGGCVATSNTLAGKLFNIPVRGTHAHSWVTAFPTEQAAFAAYVDVMPHNAVLLVDTYSTLQGVKNAITIGKKLREQGDDLLGIRLDSGDLAELSKQARKLLDDAGFNKTDILASNSLDEYVVAELKSQGAAITSWGVGTNLATAFDQPALDGVYKLSALQSNNGKWEYKLKISDQPIKVSNPGRHQVRRFFANGYPVADVIYDLDLNISNQPAAIILEPSLSPLQINNSDQFIDLLVPIYKQGELVYSQPNIHELRKYTITNVARFYQHQQDKPYPVALEKSLYELKQELIGKLK